MIAKQIKLSSSTEISIKWDDGCKSKISLVTLRDNCPCAGCQGETILLKTYKPAQQPELHDRYKIIGIEQVGHYAIQISWGDGHTTGIYPWLLLRNLCECTDCMAKSVNKDTE